LAASAAEVLAAAAPGEAGKNGGNTHYANFALKKERSFLTGTFFFIGFF
jgi:hypothetical protein